MDVALLSLGRRLDRADVAALGLVPEPLLGEPRLDPKAAQSVPVAPRYAAFRGPFFASFGGAKNAAIISPSTLFAAS